MLAVKRNYEEKKRVEQTVRINKQNQQQMLPLRASQLHVKGPYEYIKGCEKFKGYSHQSISFISKKNVNNKTVFYNFCITFAQL
jgi:hypothetical protein